MLYIDWDEGVVTRLTGHTLHIINLILNKNYERAGLLDALSISIPALSGGWAYSKTTLLFSYGMLVLFSVAGIFIPFEIMVFLFILFLTTFLFFSRKLYISILVHAFLLGTLFSMGTWLGVASFVLVVIARILMDIPLERTLNEFHAKNNFLASVFLYGKLFPMQDDEEFRYCIRALRDEYDVDKTLIIYSYLSGIHNSEKDLDEDIVKFIDNIYEEKS